MAKRSFDGGRDCEKLQQSQHPSCKNTTKKYDTVGAETMQKDSLRTKDLENMHVSVLSVCNLDIDRNFDGVCEYITLAVKNSLPQSFASQNPAPSSEGAKR
ncbi:MAG: hypothetical protein J6L00_01705 [Clostridia bacterium]|nr:hypothetical protein [Clostridia bacterium]